MLDEIFYINPEYHKALDDIETMYYNGLDISYILLEMKRYVEKNAFSPGEKEGLMQYLIMFLRKFLKDEGDNESLRVLDSILSSIENYDELEEIYEEGFEKEELD